MKKILWAVLIAAWYWAPVIPPDPTGLAAAQQVTTIPGVQQAIPLCYTGAAQKLPDSVPSVQMCDREGNTKVTFAHGLYTEPARRGRLFSLQNLNYTLTAENVSGSNVGTAQPITGFYNPTGSGVNAVIVNHREWTTSGTPGGPFIFNFLCGQNWTSVSSGTIVNDYFSSSNPNGSAMIPQANQNLNTTPAVTTAMNAFVPAGGPTTKAVTASSGEAGHSENDQGQIVVPPGCAFGVFATAAGTSHVVNASLTWEEVAP